MRSTGTTSPPIARGRREHRKHLTRQDLLAAGRRLFGEQGLYESRIEDLTRHAGIAKGTLYGYFANKQELMEAVVTAGFSELLGHVDRAVHEAEDADAALVACVQAHFDFFESNPDLMRVFHQVRGMLKFNLPEGRPLRRVLSHYLASLGDTIAPLLANGRAPAREPVELATLLFGAVSGVSSTHASMAGAPPAGAHSRLASEAIAGMMRRFGAESPEPAPRAARASKRAPAGGGRTPSGGRSSR